MPLASLPMKSYSRGQHTVYYHRYHIVWITKYRYKIGSLGIAVGYPNILWSTNHYYPQEHPHDYPH
jgi:hypothetical protein